VVIADDGSRPDQVAALRQGVPRFGCRVRHVWHPDVGFTASQARNLGALHAGADYLVFLDGDCVPNRRFVDMHARLAAPGAFVNGSRTLLGQALTARVLSGEVDLSGLHPADWLRLRMRGEVNKLTHLLAWAGAPGRLQPHFRWKGIRSCNLGVWYGDLQAVNGFDQAFSGWGHEDADLVLRLHNHGCVRKNGYLATEVFHLAHPETSRLHEASNRDRVLARLHDHCTRAEVGLAQARAAADAVVTELN
jgi:GT2 family glycosyltransferase